MMNVVIQYVLFLVILVLLAIPLGKYIGKVMNGEKLFLSRIIRPIEKKIYKLMRIDENEEMSWKKYAISVVVFSSVFLLILFLLILIQGLLPLNPAKVKGTSWDLAFNTAVSFITNTNWQSYSGEAQLSYFTQMIGLTVQNFVSAAVGISVLFALIRGFARTKSKSIGSFWVDVTRSILYVLLPLSIAVSLLLVSQGVVQSFKGYDSVNITESYFDGNDEVHKEVVPIGPAASQIAIKQLGTNGGGFFGVNSAHPFENPTPFSNLVEMISILVIPAALCFTFGRNVKDKKQGKAIFIAMMVVLVLALAVVAVNEQIGTPQLANNGQVDVSMINQPGGNMEGKESRFGIASSATWGVFTTAASNGSVNSMHDSYTPIGGMVLMLLMMLGEVIFGGVGCGLYGMMGFAILTVFIAGLMIGRTPEYLGKKIEPLEMKMAAVICFTTPVVILIGSAAAVMWPGITGSINNSGPHGFSEILYAFSSAGANNGSAFAGFNADKPFLNVLLAVCMLAARFAPMMAVLCISGSLAKKKKIASTAGTLSTSNGMFIALLIFVILLVGALSFFPALSLGPIIEHLKMIS